jgi:serine/threonine protein kinase
MLDHETEDLGRRAGRPATPATLGPGAVLGAWRLDHHLAAGGCGAVYRGHHLVLGRDAAIKVLHPHLADDPAMVARFIREAQAINRIGHPNIVDVFDVGTCGPHTYLVMELLDDANLEQRLDGDGRLTLPECLAVLAPVADALTAAHRAGFVHRDVKARNIGFTRARLDDPGGEVRLLDFGIAKLLGDGGVGSSATVRMGTPHCIAPEQIRGESIDARTDVYALGVLLFHLATAVYPFDGDDSSEVERKHLDAPPPRPSDLVPELAIIDDLIAWAMAKAPDRRPATPRAVVDALRAAINGTRVRRAPARLARPAPRRAASHATPRRRRDRRPGG